MEWSGLLKCKESDKHVRRAWQRREWKEHDQERRLKRGWCGLVNAELKWLYLESRDKCLGPNCIEKLR